MTELMLIQLALWYIAIGCAIAYLAHCYKSLGRYLGIMLLLLLAWPLMSILIALAINATKEEN